VADGAPFADLLAVVAHEGDDDLVAARHLARGLHEARDERVLSVDRVQVPVVVATLASPAPNAPDLRLKRARSASSMTYGKCVFDRCTTPTKGACKRGRSATTTSTSFASSAPIS